MDRNTAGGGIGGVANSSAKVPEIMINGNQAGAETAAKASDNMVAVSNLESRRSAGDVSGSLTTSTRGHSSEDTARTAGMNHPSGSESRPAFGRANSNDTVAADSAKASSSRFMVSPQSVPGPQSENDKMTGRTALPAENSSGADPGQPSPRPTVASDLNPALNRASDVRLHSTAGEEPVSRLFQETRLTGEGVNRMSVDLTDEPTGKVVKSEAATGDNGLLNSSGQNAEKMPEGTAPVKDADAGQGLNRNQTLDQIVRRAAIHLRNGQQEARIELKPDFLGHVRLQIISENHQVTVKILAEHGFVKDMIENNLHQLKADLQQQGLEVDKVEVSVSQDSEEGANSREKLAQSKIKQGAANPRNEHHAADEHEQEPRHTPSSSDPNATIDYFA
jgi:flagellar hook-length control protein FliK